MKKAGESMKSAMISSVIFAFYFLSCGVSENPGTAKQLNHLIKKDQIIEVVNKLFINTDKRDWEEVRACFAPEVLFDMTSMAGGEPTTLTPQQIVDAWDQGLKALKAIHHQVGNYLVSVNGNEANVFCYGIASHYLPNKTQKNTRTFVGSYDFGLVKDGESWKINHFKFNLKYMTGNPRVEKS
jgi:hypothetical protein